MAYIRTAFTENGTFVANAMKVSAAPRLTATFDVLTQAVTLDLAPSGVTVGTYNSVSVDAFGRIVTGTMAPYLLGNQSIAITGDATGSGATSIALVLSSTGVVAGTYSFATVAVDAKGRVSFASSGSIPPSTIDFSGDATGSGATGSTIALTLANSGVAAGTYTSVSVDAKGRVVAGTNPGFLTANQTITVSGDATGSGSTAIALTLADSGVAAGTYQLATVTVDSKGRVVAAASGSIAPQSLAFSGEVSGSGVTGGTVALTLANVGTPGTYNLVTTDARGRVSSGSLAPYLLSNQTITLSGDATGSGATAIAVTLADSGVAAGSYNFATVVVDSKGRVTLAQAGSPVTSVALAGAEFSFAGGPITTAGTISIALAPSGVSAGTFSSVVVDSKGRVTAGTNPGFLTAESDTLASVAARGALTTATLTVGGIIGNASTASALQTVRAISVAGDATGSANFDGTEDATITLALANSGVAAGTYSLATVAVDAKGRVTFAASGSMTSGPALAAGTFDVARVTVNESGQISAVAATSVVNRGTSAVVMVQSAGTLAFKSIRAGSNVTVTQNADEVTIAASAGAFESFTFRVNLDGSGNVTSIQDVSSPDITVVTGTNADEVNVTYAAKPGRLPMIAAFARNTTAPSRFIHRVPVNARGTAFNAQVYEDFTGFYLDGVSATNLGATAGQYIIFRFMV